MALSVEYRKLSAVEIEMIGIALAWKYHGASDKYVNRNITPRDAIEEMADEACLSELTSKEMRQIRKVWLCYSSRIETGRYASK